LSKNGAGYQQRCKEQEKYVLCHILDSAR